jgi:hypothetical protein
VGLIAANALTVATIADRTTSRARLAGRPTAIPAEQGAAINLLLLLLCRV